MLECVDDAFADSSFLSHGDGRMMMSRVESTRVLMRQACDYRQDVEEYGSEIPT